MLKAKKKISIILVLVVLIINLFSQENLSSSINKFSIDFYNQIKDENGNFIFSPYSITTLMAMAFTGSNSNTADQIATVMYFTKPKNDISILINTLLKNSLNIGKSYNYNIINTLWLQKDYKILDLYKNSIISYYNADVKYVDFMKDNLARNEINKYIKKITNNNINKIINEKLSQKTKMILSNIVYFNGIWKNEFNKKETKNGTFYIDNNKSVTTKMMNTKMVVNYYSDDESRMIDLPYTNGKMSMTIILPKVRNGLDTVEEHIAKYLNSIDFTVFQDKKLEISIPKLSINSEYDLKEILKRLGVTDAFEYKKADFSNIDGIPYYLYVGWAKHAATITVNEQGTEASAVTIGGGCFTGDTEVLTKNGTMKIEQIIPDTDVYTYNDRDEKWEINTVNKVIEQEYNGEFFLITINDDTIKATSNHPFYVKNGNAIQARPWPNDIEKNDDFTNLKGRWVEAKDLQIGDELISMNDGSSIIKKIEIIEEKAIVYNLNIEDNHNYLVGKQGILVHNKGGRDASVEEYIVDHPFLFFIRENDNNNIVFIGRVLNPNN